MSENADSRPSSVHRPAESRKPPILHRIYDPTFRPHLAPDRKAQVTPLICAKRPLHSETAVYKPKCPSRRQHHATEASLSTTKHSSPAAGQERSTFVASDATNRSASPSIVMHPSLSKALENSRILPDPLDAIQEPIKSPPIEGSSLLAAPSSFLASLSLSPHSLHELKHGNFVYLRKRSDTDYVMYALEVIAPTQVDRADYYTLSAQGLTHFTTAASAFWPLQTWEVEYTRFMTLVTMPFFRQYRVWKHFQVWKRRVRTGKIGKAKNALRARLFLLTPRLRATLLTQRALCLDLMALDLVHLPRTLSSFHEFQDQQATTRAHVTQALATFSTQSLTLCVDTCDTVLDAFLSTHHIAATHTMTFMERAALRKECRVLTHFLRLIDFLIIDATIQLTVSSFQRVYALLTRHGEDKVDATPRGRDPSSGHDRRAVFQVTVGIEDTTGALTAWPTHEAWNDALQSVLKEALRVVETPVRHLGHEALAPYTTATAEEEGKDSWSVETLNVALILNEDAAFSTLTNNIFLALDDAFEAVEEALDVFQPFLHVYAANERQLTTDVLQVYATAPLETFATLIEQYKAQDSYFAAMPDTATIGLFRVDATALKTRFLPTPSKCLVALRALLPQLMAQTSHALLETLHAVSPRAFSTPVTPDTFVEKLQHMVHVGPLLVEGKRQYRRVFDLGLLMDQYSWRVPDALKEDIILMKEGVLSLETALARFEDDVEAETARFATVLVDALAAVNDDARDLLTTLRASKLASIETSSHEAVAVLTRHQARLDQLVTDATRLTTLQAALNQAQSPVTDVTQVVAFFHVHSTLWHGVATWQGVAQSLGATPVDAINVSAMQAQVQVYATISSQVQQELPAHAVAALLQHQVDAFTRVLPIVTDLRCPVLKERHWQQLDALLGFVFTDAKDLTLQALMARNVVGHGAAIHALVVSAQQEVVLEATLQHLTSLWATIEFDVIKGLDAKETFLLARSDDVTHQLDESLVTLHAMAGSPYLGALHHDVEAWRKKLATVRDTLDDWLVVQHKWQALAPVFAAPESQRQLPTAAKLFQHVDGAWKSLMRRTKETPHVLTAATVPGLKDGLHQSHAQCDAIQTLLVDYLETKRMACPRLYFVPNAAVLAMLAHAKTPDALARHARTCFEPLARLETRDAAGSVEIVAIVSLEGERVALHQPVQVRGNVEEWLKALETRMNQAMRQHMKAGVVAPDALGASPGQVAAVVAQLVWASRTEAALSSRTPVEELDRVLQRTVKDVDEASGRLRGDVSALERQVTGTAVTWGVHARDVVDTLKKTRADAVGTFIWQQQLRYYWDASTDVVVLRHLDTDVPYGYEYLGATSRVVVTPLTDRCWLALTRAYGMKVGAALVGPAGTGKTASCQDLAKALAVQCIVVPCSGFMDYQAMGTLFRGVAQAGNWLCLDAVDRLEVTVVSVVAQQLFLLREGRVQGKEHVNFMGREIGLKDHHVIVTINPGYAGRTELPENLKIGLRPVAMMVPDSALIAETMLLVEGFSRARLLSRKLCTLYLLCSEQLSQQCHYDFGLRALKCVVGMAGARQRANSDLNEDKALIQALVDSTLPQLVAEDLLLFHALVSDLFPGTVISSNDDDKELQACLETEISKAGFQIVAAFTTKVVQLFDTLKAWGGGTLVGATGVGKTSCYRLLQSTLTSLRALGSKNPAYQTVHVRVLNPKCISMGELYGQVHEATQEWHDGLVASLVREAVADESNDFNWIVFDGPIDPLWMENLNSALDDNRILCLANGERIKLQSEIKLLFEVMDLAVASPATVSRTGVVYMTAMEVTWMAFVKTWLQDGFEEDFPVAARARLAYLMDTFVEKCMQFLRTKAIEVVPTVDINLATSLCRLFASVFHPQNGVDYVNLPTDEMLRLLDKMFVFALVWSLGATMTVETHCHFDAFVRDLLTPLHLHLPTSGLVLDYFVDTKTANFRAWTDVVPTFVYNIHVPYHEIIVPTLDSVRLTYVLRTLIAAKRPTYLTGMTGTGKSVLVHNVLHGLTLDAADDSVASTVSDFQTLCLDFSAQTSSLVTQSTIEKKLEKKRNNLLGPHAANRLLIFVDDVHLPKIEDFGAQGPIELLRQFVEFHGFYDRTRFFWKEIVDTMVLAAATSAEGDRRQCTPRFLRHFHVLSLYPAGEASLILIFSSILGGFLQSFVPTIQLIKDSVVTSVIELYQRVTVHLLPTPDKFHYTFNLRDVSRIFQGISRISPQKCTDVDTMNRLWVHEASRVFQDRLINPTDHVWYEELVCSLLHRHCNSKWTRETLFHAPCPLLFGDFGPEKGLLYAPCADLTKMTKCVDTYLDQYNTWAKRKMELVFFRDALAHLSRLVRILRQPRGHAMLLGVAGCGKQSLARLGAFMVDATCVQIPITRGYSTPELQDALKKLLTSAGVAGQATVLLVTESQMSHERFVDAVHHLLTSGHVPNLFPPDEMERILADVRPIVKSRGLSETRANCTTVFRDRVRTYLHIVLVMSPLGPTLRHCCRTFPSLLRSCTIDWYTEWPQEALVAVAKHVLTPVSFPSDDMRNALETLSAVVHNTLRAYNHELSNHCQRYVSGTKYLDLLSSYQSMVSDKQREHEALQRRLERGLERYNDTNTIVTTLRATVLALEPRLTTKAQEYDEVLARVTMEQKAAAVVRESVAQDAALVATRAAQRTIMEEELQHEVEAATAARSQALHALEALSKHDLNELQSLSTPPQSVENVLHAVCLVLKEPLEWEAARVVLNDEKLLDRLRTVAKDRIPFETFHAVQARVREPEMAVEMVAKVSIAAAALCQWVHAIILDADVDLKQETVARIKQEDDEAQEKVRQNHAEVDVINDTLATSTQRCHEVREAKQALANDVESARTRLARAESVVATLASESARWTERVLALKASRWTCIGDTFLAAACLSYVGPFPADTRERIVTQWITQMQEMNVPCSPRASLATIVGHPIALHEWQGPGLELDATAVENALLVTQSRRWPLVIDPQGQASTWLQTSCAATLIVTKMTSGNVFQDLEQCLWHGKALLVEHVDEAVDGALESMVAHASLLQEAAHGGDASAAFRLYCTTRGDQVAFGPELYRHVTVIDWTLTKEGVAKHLLSAVVHLERPDLEAKRHQVGVSRIQDERALLEMEARMLHDVAEAIETLVDDEKVVATLQSLTEKSCRIQERLDESRALETEINRIRDDYRCVATRGAILYSVMTMLSRLDPMYQTSWSCFQRAFTSCVVKVPRPASIALRLETLMAVQTQSLYARIARGLFAAHRKVFAMLLWGHIQLASGALSTLEWHLYLYGPTPGLDRAKQGTNPHPAHLSAVQWDFVSELETIGTTWHPESKATRVHHPFQGLCTSLTTHWPQWCQWLDSPFTMMTTWPGNEATAHQSALTAFQNILLVRALAEAKVPHAIDAFLAMELGRPVGHEDVDQDGMEIISMDLDRTTPCLFLLSRGVEPRPLVVHFARKKAFHHRLHVLSLGSGPFHSVDKVLQTSQKGGDWVLLENCHLAPAWLPTLASRLDAMHQDPVETCHPTFRLYLTSASMPSFPLSVLQTSVKVAPEALKGFRATLLGSLPSDAMETFDSTDVLETGEAKALVWHRLVWALLLFHSVVQERLKGRAWGWNAPWAFHALDLELSVATLRQVLAEHSKIPWDALRYVIGHVHYGGHVADDWDRRGLVHLLDHFVTPAVVQVDHANLLPAGYHVPPELTHEKVQAFFDAVPSFDNSEVFGMHEHATGMYARHESTMMRQLLASLEPRFSDADGPKLHDAKVLDLVVSIQATLPAELHVEEAGPTTFKTRQVAGRSVMDSLATVLGQEMSKFNLLLRRMRTSLQEMQKAINGLLAMSADLETMYMALLNGQVPGLWTCVSFASRKPLASWVRDVIERVAFLRQWLLHGEPVVFRLNVFFFPQSFIAAILQNFARKHETAIESLALTFTVLDITNAQEVTQSPTDGVYIDGLWLQGAQWSPARCVLEDANPGEMFSPMSIVHFLPATSSSATDTATYACPVYKTSDRQGTLSTSGISSNYVLAIPLPSRKPPNYWVMMDTAFFLNLDT